MPGAAQTPAVVLGCFSYGGLAIVRSLGRLGAPIWAVHPERTAPAFFSRYARGRVVWDIDSASVDESLRFLEALSRRIGRRAVLIATSDSGAAFVAQNAERLSQWFIFPVQDPDLVRSLCSKKDMYHLARKWGLATPETAFPRSMADVESYLETARFPVLVKPVSSGPKAFRMRLVHSQSELVELCESLWRTSPIDLMLQEYIAGADGLTWVLNGYFDGRGECLLAITGRKLRNYPPYFGAGSLGVCADNEEVKRITLAFMKAVGYRGGLDLGYRYDVRDGRYKVHDINPRIGAMFRCFVGENGIDVARAIYRDMTGQPVVASTAREGRKWIVEDHDLITALRYYRDGILTPGEWFGSLRKIGETSYLSLDDPLPLAAMLLARVGRAWTRLGRLVSRTRWNARSWSPRRELR